MQTINFIVNSLNIQVDDTSVTDNLVPGTEGFLRANFSFSNEWNGFTKVAAFFSNLGVEYSPQAINADGTCMIPFEALKKSIFKVQVIGKKRDQTLRTNKVTIRQKGVQS